MALKLFKAYYKTDLLTSFQKYILYMDINFCQIEFY